MRHTLEESRKVLV